MLAFPSVETVFMLGETLTSYNLLQLLQRWTQAGAYWPRLRRLALPHLKTFDRPLNYHKIYNCMATRIHIGYPIGELALCTQGVDQMIVEMKDDVLPFAMPLMNLVTVVDWIDVTESWREQRTLRLDA